MLWLAVVIFLMWFVFWQGPGFNGQYQDITMPGVDWRKHLLLIPTLMLFVYHFWLQGKLLPPRGRS